MAHTTLLEISCRSSFDNEITSFTCIGICISAFLGDSIAWLVWCLSCLKLGDNCIQNFHLGRYIVGYTVGNLVLRRRASGAVKRDFRTYIRRYTSPNENFEYGYPILMHFCSFLSNWSAASRVKPYAIQPRCDVINDVKQFATVYHRIYCSKFLTLSNQMSRYKIKCIRKLNINIASLQQIHTLQA